MSRFHESIRILLTDVEQFLVESLKAVTLPASPEQHRQRLLEQISGIRSQFPNLNLPSPLSKDALKEPAVDYPNGAVDNQARTGNEGGLLTNPTLNTAGSPDYEDETYSDTIAPLAAGDLTGAQKTGTLSKKRKPGDIRAKVSPYQKRWCIIKGPVFYYYEKQTDKKQCGAFSLLGYEFRNAPYLEKDANKKELCFELTKPGNRNFQFIAMNKLDYAEWKTAIDRAVILAARERATPAANSPTAVTNNGVIGANADFNDDEGPQVPVMDKEVLEIYEPIEDLPPQDTPQSPVNPPPNLALKRAISEEIYDDIESRSSTDTHQSAEIYHDAETILRKPDVTSPQNGTPTDKELPDFRPDSEEIYDDIGGTNSFAIDDEIYDDIGNMAQTVPSNGLVCPDHRDWKIGAWNDYENIYLCKCDCTADRSDHLAFKSGDLIHILSKKDDVENWWIGEFGGKIGLVPKTYLTEAYELA